MTCIVGIAEGGKVWLGGDSAGLMNQTVLPLSAGKVFRLGEFVMGSCGNRRFSEIALHDFRPPRPRTNNLGRYMARDFVRALRAACERAGYLNEQDGRDRLDEGDALLVGLRGRLFLVGQDFSASGVEGGIFSIGCGADFALGAITATPGMEPVKRLNVALMAAEKWSDGVVGPFDIVTTRS